MQTGKTVQTKKTQKHTMAPASQSQRRLRSATMKEDIRQGRSPSKSRPEERVKAVSVERGIKIKREMIEFPRPLVSGKGGSRREPIRVEDGAELKRYRPAEKETEQRGNNFIEARDVRGIVGVANVNGDIHFHPEHGVGEEKSKRKVSEEKQQKEDRTRMNKGRVARVDFMKEFEEEVDREVEARYARQIKAQGQQRKDPLSTPLPASPKRRRDGGEGAREELEAEEAGGERKAITKSKVRIEEGEREKNSGKVSIINRSIRPSKSNNTYTEGRGEKGGNNQEGRPKQRGEEHEGKEKDTNARGDKGEPPIKYKEGKGGQEEIQERGKMKGGRGKEGQEEAPQRILRVEIEQEGEGGDIQEEKGGSTKEEVKTGEYGNKVASGGHTEDKAMNKETNAIPEGGETQSLTQKTMKDVVITEPAIVKRKHTFRVQFSFTTTGPPNTPVAFASAQGLHLQKAIKEFLQKAQEIDSTAVVNTWKEEDKRPTLQKGGDVPATMQDVRKYIRAPPGSRIKSGAINWYWSIKVSANSKMEEFVEVWESERRRAPREHKPCTIRPTPLQAEEWHESGLFIGSTADQVVDTLIEGLREELQDPNMGLNWQSIVFPGCNKFWAIARERGQKHGTSAKYASAPMALQVLVDDRKKIKQTLKTLYSKYGKVEEDGSWPTLPDGSRMRFIPNFQFSKDAMSKKRIEKRMQLQIQMHWSNRIYPIPVKDPRKTVEIEGRKTTIGNLVLEEICHTEAKGPKIQEPYFRHFVRRWTPAQAEGDYDIAVHKHMAPQARKKLKTL